MTPEEKPDLVVSIPTALPLTAADLKRIRSVLCEQFDQVRMSFVNERPRRLVFECRNVVEDWVEVTHEKEEKK